MSYHFGLGVLVSYLGIFVIGVAVGAIETLEPTIISLVRSRTNSGSGMGALTSSRSIGLFAANIALGFLYVLGPLYAYGFAAAMAMLAGIVLLGFGSKSKI